MLLIPFVGKNLRSANRLAVSSKVNRESYLWFPLVMGVATKEEIEVASMEQLQYLNEIADIKQKMLGGGAFE